MASAHEFVIRESLTDDVVTLQLRGEFDLAAADSVGNRLEALAASQRPVLLDLDAVEFMDSSGLRVVLQAVQRSEESDWRFAVTPGSDQVRRLFEASGVSAELPIEQK